MTDKTKSYLFDAVTFYATFSPESMREFSIVNPHL